MPVIPLPLGDRRLKKYCLRQHLVPHRTNAAGVIPRAAIPSAVIPSSVIPIGATPSRGNPSCAIPSHGKERQTCMLSLARTKKNS